MTKSNQRFATTQWTLVWNAAKDDAQRGRPALEELIRSYWIPLYSFARRQGFNREDAEDATQEFLSGVVRGDLLRSADPAKGKFRSFLLVAWKRFLIDEYRRRRAHRRGGHVKLLSVDFGTSERQWLEIQSRETDPDRQFKLSWAKSLLDEVRNRLEENYSRRDRKDLLAALMPKLTETLTQSQYCDLGKKLSLSPSAIKVALHRLRQRFGQTLREVVSETLDDSSEIDAELAELQSVIAGHDNPLAEIRESTTN
ncbi:MAG: sigma-70 family RNA polymerase sigma factor [Planctomycetota bacterium]